MKSIALTIIITSLLATGCAWKPQEKANAGIVDDMLCGCLTYAQAAYQARQYETALMEFRKVADHSPAASQKKLGRLGAGRCYLKLADPAAALRCLQPVPPGISRANQAQWHALTGEAYLRLDDPKEAQGWLERALDGVDSAAFAPAWLAGCTANLACAYLKTGQDIPAAAMYQRASALFAQQGQSRHAEESFKIAQSLNRYHQTKSEQ